VKFARIIGRVTLSVADPSYRGGRFLMGLPCTPDTDMPRRSQPLPKGNSFVLYDNHGATEGDLIAYTDGGEASAPFPEPTPCDAYNAAILDTINWTPLSNR